MKQQREIDRLALEQALQVRDSKDPGPRNRDQMIYLIEHALQDMKSERDAVMFFSKVITLAGSCLHFVHHVGGLADQMEVEQSN